MKKSDIKSRDFCKNLRNKSGKIGLISAAILVTFVLGVVSFYSINTLAKLSLFGTREVADGPVSCGHYIGNYSGCMALNSSCNWGNNSGAILQDPWCLLNSSNYNSITYTMWMPDGRGNLPYNTITGGLLINAGCCISKPSGGGGGQMSCWNFEGNRTGCLNSSIYGVTGCNWKPNSANQNPWCPVKKIGDWAGGKIVENIDDVGCCEKAGCWSYGGDQSLLGANNCTNVLNGVCSYSPGGSAGCPESSGCCWPKSCSEVSTSAACNQLIQLDMPCVWNQSGSNVCGMRDGGGFNMYNDTDSCMSKGGWWNSTGSCVMPGGTGGGGGGGFMFAQEAKCWFADERPNICRNVTGCVYCNSSDILRVNSACYNEEVNICQGHESLYTNWNGTANINITDINQSSMICGDIRLKQTCLCGPLPNCIWTNSSTSVGPVGTTYCQAGMKTSDQMQLCVPPAQFCEDSKAKNNETMCNELANNYMMPCKWDNSTTPANNCTFNSVAVFGSSGGSMDYNLIGGETSCVAAGGTWKSEYYMDGADFKEDAWCEKGAMFDFSTGMASGNKGNCNSDCWACEFNSTGGNYGGNLTLAQATCLGSAKGICRWREDTNAPNHLGWCDYPQEMSFGGAKDCNSDCKACEFFQNPSQACSGSPAGCAWINETNAPNGQGGYCLSGSKKSCSTDCFSCYEQTTCSNSSFHSSMNCSWDSGSNFCKPSSFTGEICFNGKDDDGNGQTDCTDPFCTYDQFCGGASIGGSGGSDCKKLSSADTCRAGRAASGKNCTWVTPAWGGGSYCDFPGSSCWLYENNASACTTGIGCFWKNASSTPPLSGFCEVNKTKASPCFSLINSTGCNNNNDCQWMNDSYMLSGGRCEFKPFAVCGAFNVQSLATCSSAGGGNYNCSWRNDSFSPNGGFCESTCFSKTNNNSCASAGAGCMWRSTACEPEMFGGGGGGGGGSGGGGCHMFDSNQTQCNQQNMTCSWVSFPGGGSQGACEGKGERMMFQGMDQSPPKILGSDAADATPSEIDIKEYGVKDMASSLSFGIIVTNITNAAVCRGYMIGGMGGFGGGGFIGNGSATTKFYWYLDTNKNTTDGCTGAFNSTTNSTGYEFLIKYVTVLSNTSASETKSFYKCSGGSWALTNVPLTSNRQFMCSMSIPFGGGGKVGGVMIIVDKENLESFTTYNKTVPMKVMVTSANGTYSENNPLDWVSAPGYYTHGSADFKFVDCSNPNTKDEKCKNFQKFGFNVNEDCKNGIDDDSDGLVDCADPKCTFTPVCAGGSAFIFTANANDKEAPNVEFSNIETLHNGAFVKFDSNEPANGSLTFYSNDSSCMTVNRTIADVGDPNIAFDDYKPFHMIPLDDTSLPGFSSGLTNGTIYYYKTSICDPSGNCAESACQNFTTKSENAYKNFVFKMKLAPGFNVTIPSLGYSGNFTTTVGGRVYEAGIKANASVTKNINVTVNCGNQSLTLVGADIFKPKSIDMSGAFICDSNSTNSVLGMNSSSKAWNQVVSDLSMGGSGDYIKLSLPVNYSSSNNITWCNDELTNCTNVNNYANCSFGGTGKTDCKIPTSLGFSVYRIVTLSAGTTSDSSSSSSSSGGGGGGGGGASTYTLTDAEFVAGYTKELSKNDQLKVNVSGKSHSIKLTGLTATTATINVSSKSQTATLNVGEQKEFDVTEDGANDLSVKLNSINSTAKKASFTVKSLAQPTTTTGPSGTGPTTSTTPTQKKTPSLSPEKRTETGFNYLWLIVLAVIIVIVAVILLKRSSNKKRRGY